MPVTDWNPILEACPNDAKLWRYLDLSRFLDLVTQKVLYFSRLREFDDKWEGVITQEQAESWFALQTEWGLKNGGNVEQTSKEIKQALIKTNDHFRVSCWHQNEAESVAMWKLYTRGSGGVAIQTTSERLATSLTSEVMLLRGKVQYIDRARPLNANILFPSFSEQLIADAFRKRLSFRHENEVRLVYFDTGLDGGKVSVDTNRLIERIVASPDYPAWAVPSLQAIVEAAGLEVKVETSDLLKPPQE
jgi:hypothetical protein